MNIISYKHLESFFIIILHERILIVPSFILTG